MTSTRDLIVLPVRRLSHGFTALLLLNGCGDSTGPSSRIEDFAGTWAETACTVASVAPPPRSEPCNGSYGSLVVQSSGAFIFHAGALPGEDSLEIHGHIARDGSGWRGFLAVDGGFPVALSSDEDAMTWTIPTNFVFGDSGEPESALLTQTWVKSLAP